MALIRITPDREKAKSILKMASLIEERIKKQQKSKFSSLIIVDYYEIVKELITAVLLVDGYKTLSHKDLVDYLNEKYHEFGMHEITLIDDLRILRNRVSYEGFFIKPDFLYKNELEIKNIIKKIKNLLKKRAYE